MVLDTDFVPCRLNTFESREIYAIKRVGTGKISRRKRRNSKTRMRMAKGKKMRDKIFAKHCARTYDARSFY